MVWLPDGVKRSKISLFVLTECMNVTDTPHNGIDRAYASHRAAKTSDFDEIWYTTADLELDDSHVTKYEK